MVKTIEPGAIHYLKKQTRKVMSSEEEREVIGEYQTIKAELKAIDEKRRSLLDTHLNLTQGLEDSSALQELIEREDQDNDSYNILQSHLRFMRDYVLESNYAAVMLGAKKVAGKWGRKDLMEDLLAPGVEGLMIALETYDLSRGTKFLTHADYLIFREQRREMIELTHPIHLPEHALKRASEERKREMKSRQKAQEDPLKKLYEPTKDEPTVKAMNARSLGQLDKHYDLRAKQIESSLEVEEQEMLEKKTKDLLKESIAELKPREQEIIRMRFGLDGDEPMTLKEIGSKIGGTRQNAEQMQRRAFKKLRECMGAEPTPEKRGKRYTVTSAERKTKKSQQERAIQQERERQLELQAINSY